MDQEPLRIEIVEETPLQPEINSVTTTTERVAQAAVSSARQAWQSETRKKVTGTVGAGIAKGTHLVQERVARAAADKARAQVDAAQTRFRETDWKQVARTKATAALRWCSNRLDRLATRFTPPEKPPGTP